MEESLTGWDMSAAEQFFASLRRSEPLEPERALLVAILEDGISDYLKYRRARDRDGKERFRDAADWVAGSSGDWIFSFDNVCELLDLDPKYVRRLIYEYRDRTGEEKSAT
jgi:hypothetical protein